MQNEYIARRKKLSGLLPAASIVLLPGAKIQYRNADAEYPFRQNSDFYYLTGFSEPDAFLVIRKDGDNKLKYILFNLPHDPEAEIWSGKRIGQDEACKTYAADEAYVVDQMQPVVSKLLQDMQHIYCPKDFDLSAWDNIPESVVNVLPLIHEMRLIKSAIEISELRKAAQISAQAHNQLLQACHPGVFEYQLEAMFTGYCMQEGCRALAYTPIVASGNNACTLHYVENTKKIADKELVLIDAGGEFNNYAADITRTIPANGKFSVEQRAIYELVLAAQLRGIEQVKPGNTWNKVQEGMLQVIVQGLVELGIMQGEVDQLIKDKAYRKFYMHSSGHWLGLDVHDAGTYQIEEKWRKFVPGMVLTVEPGIYISKGCDGVAEKWHGIGVRIEDDILVTDGGNEVLSQDAIKQVIDIENAAV